MFRDFLSLSLQYTEHLGFVNFHEILTGYQLSVE